jgi:hypothetical protein
VRGRLGSHVACSPAADGVARRQPPAQLPPHAVAPCHPRAHTPTNPPHPTPAPRRPQALSNGLQPPYGATLRAVRHEGSRAPRAGPVKSTKPPVSVLVGLCLCLWLWLGSCVSLHLCQVQFAVCPAACELMTSFDPSLTRGLTVWIIPIPAQGYCRNAIGGFFTS